MAVGKKYRGNFEKVLNEYVVNKLGDGVYDDFMVFITHAGTDQKNIDAVKAQVESIAGFKRVEVTRAGPTITCHCGRNTLGVLFVAQ
jgi:fatty acid-binding protein DegV